jgi:hypothetical protein
MAPRVPRTVRSASVLEADHPHRAPVPNRNHSAIGDVGTIDAGPKFYKSSPYYNDVVEYGR